jgi:translation initiation factor IF-2
LSLKVFQLAKELGVDSKAIIKKCKDEQLANIETHMSPISAGQAATIREWFASGEMKTAVEETAHVETGANKRKRPTRTRTRHGDESSGGDSATAVAEPPSAQIEMEAPAVPETTIVHGETATAEVEEAQPVVETAPPVAEPQVRAAPEAVVEAPVETPVKPVRPTGGHAHTTHATQTKHAAPAHTTPTGEVPVKPVKPAVMPRGVPNVVNRPAVVAAGSRNVPAPAQMQGPKVVRVEQPDNLPAPRARPRPQAASQPQSSQGASASARVSAANVPLPPSETPTRSRSKPGAPIVDEEETRAARLNKSRTARRKGGRSADAGADLIREWREADLADRAERIASATGVLKERRREMSKTQQRQQAAHAPAQRPDHIEVTPPVTVRQLAEALGVKANDILKKLMAQGAMATVNQVLEPEAAQVMALEYGIELVVKAKESPFAILERQYKEKADAAEMLPRAPVVTILGHVDHGKTSLLDKIRSANVAAGEAGGITQHVGAYTVQLTGSDGKEKRVTFLDTPGHKAFTAMRARGANVTDVVVLVVAADDGVMPQTIESIDHAKASGVPIVVALNKIDKAEANPNKVLGQLAEHGLNPTEWGGDTEVVRTSAVTGQGIKELIEYLDYTATLRDLRASPTLPAKGSVIEAFMDPLRGVVARVLVQNGTLHTGDVIVSGPGFGRVRSITNDHGLTVKEAGPAMPVEVIGLDEVPSAGDRFYSTEDPAEARIVAEDRRQRDRLGEIAHRSKVTLENLYDTIQKGDIKELPMILKADVQGSVDVLKQLMTEELSKEVKVRLIRAAVGGITESDVLLAETSGAIIVGFSVVPDEVARKMAEDLDVEVRLYRIIYEITDDIRKALTGLLSPTKQDQSLGHAEIRQIIRISRVGNVAGCMVTDGVLQRAAKYRLIRDGAVVAENLLLDSLKRVKEDVKEVRGGMECGLKIAGYDDLKIGDKVEAYKTVDVARSL